MSTPRFDIWAWGRSCPRRRVALWLGLIALFCAVLHFATTLVGLESPIASSGPGRSYLGLIALASALLVMSRSEREVGDFGLAIGDGWRRHALVGIGLGASVMTALVVLTLITGARTAHAAPIGEWLEATGKAFGGLPLAVSAMITFGGFVVGTLHERYGRAVSAVGAALLFGLLFMAIPTEPDESAWVEGVNRFMLMLVGAQLRLLTGDIVLGAAFFFGLFFIERLARKADLLGPISDERLAAFLAPDRRLLESPALWALLGLVAFGTALKLRVTPSPARTKARVSAAFKRAYPFATLGFLAPLDVWLVQLWRARFSVQPVYLLRLIVTLILSTVNTVLTLPERLLTPLILRGRRVAPPVFILGAHRSGTTHLHNLISLDPQFIAPSTWQVMNPFGFLVSGWLLRPILTLFAPWKRPMDSVKFGMWAPAEEEFAIANMSGLSPDWSLRLPRLAERYDRFGFPDLMTERERRRWRSLHQRFVRQFTLFSKRRPLMKNPHNTGRMAELRALYPDAKFIHIRRDPEDVYRSNADMARTGHILFQLQDPIEGIGYADRYFTIYGMMEQRFYRDAESLPPSVVADVRYEDVVARPVEVVRGVYDQLGLTWTDEFESRLRSYLEQVSDYQRNKKRPLTPEELDRLRRGLGSVWDRWQQADETKMAAPASA